MSDNFIERSRYTCAQGGAAATVTALPGGIPILHSPSGCAGNFAWTQNGGAGLQVGGYCGTLTMPSSNVQERDVVFGGDSRLREQIENTLKVMDGEIYGVLTSCVTEVIGDDIKSVVAEFKKKGVPIIGAETAGFKGNSYKGYDLVLQSLFKDFLERDLAKNKKRVNLWGIIPSYDPFWRGNLEEVRRLLEQIGLEVNSFFLANDSIETIRQAGSASLNIVLSDVYGLGAAELFEEIHTTPYVSLALPIGASATESFLRTVGKAAGVNSKRVDSVINSEKKRYYRYLEPLTDCFTDLDLQRYAIVVGDANNATAVTRFLADDLGWLPEITVCTDSLQAPEQKRLQEQLKHLESQYPSTLIFESDGSRIIDHLKKKWPTNGSKYQNTFGPAFVIGSSLDRELAIEIGAPHLSVSFPVANRAILDRGYTGFRGGLRLIEDLLGTVVAGR
ncbi:MAG: nitrogenase component 1 [Desulfuromonadales bacterium]